MYLARWFATGPLVALVVLLPPVLVLQGAAGRPSPHFQPPPPTRPSCWSSPWRSREPGFAAATRPTDAIPL
jgi:hypothetical protein